MFYTSIHTRGDKIYFRGYDKGIRVKDIVHYKPYLFIQSPKGNYRTLDNKKVDKLQFDNRTREGGLQSDSIDPNSMGQGAGSSMYYDPSIVALGGLAKNGNRAKELDLTAGNEPTLWDRTKSFFGGSVHGSTQGGGVYVSEEQLRGTNIKVHQNKKAGDIFKSNTSTAGTQYEVREGEEGGGAAAGATSGSGGGNIAPSTPTGRDLAGLRTRSDSRLGASISQDIVKGALGLGAGNKAAAAEGFLNAGSKFALDKATKGITDSMVKNGLFGGATPTTNNRMELTAAIEGLRMLKEACEVEVVTDSEYLKNGITKWIQGWKRNGWKTADRKPVKNVELWQRLDVALAGHDVYWHWVKGHAGHDDNERADELARAGMAPYK